MSGALAVTCATYIPLIWRKSREILVLPIVRSQPPPLYFMHIPKTAGTTLESVFRSIYGRHFIRIPVRRLYLYEPEQLHTFRCWQSHCGPGLLPFLPQHDLHCITMLRQPVEQVISYLYFKRNSLATEPERHHPTYQAQMAPLINADLRAWLAHPRSAFFDNFQTRYLGSILDLAPWFKTGEFGALQQRTPFPELPASLTDDRDLDQLYARAYQQLEKLAVVGITERFTESLQLICGLLGVPMPTQALSANIGPTKIQVQIDAHRQQTPPDLVEQIEARNQYDRMLYDDACELFAAQVARYRDHPHHAISLTPHLQAAKQRWGVTAKRAIHRSVSAVFRWVVR